MASIWTERVSTIYYEYEHWRWTARDSPRRVRQAGHKQERHPRIMSMFFYEYEYQYQYQYQYEHSRIMSMFFYLY